MDVFQVAEWFLHKKSFTHKQLQKLCYYAQAWHLALLHKPLFYEEFQAWVHGAVCPVLYNRYHSYGWTNIPKLKGISPKFPKDTLEILNAVYTTYSKLSGAQLENLNHSELPWKNARGNISPLESSNNIISHDSMRKFYADEYEKTQGD